MTALGTHEGRARDRLRDAIYARKLHADDCPCWDYEATNCEDCDRHDAKVRAARDALTTASIRALAPRRSAPCPNCGVSHGTSGCTDGW